MLLTTHYLEEAESLADEISIMRAGRIVRSGTPAEIVADHPSEISFVTPGTEVPPVGELRVRHDGSRTVLDVEDLQTTLGALLRWAETYDVRLDQLAARPASLESVFLAIADEPTLEGSTR